MSSVDGIEPNSSVKLAGYKVGYVDEISPVTENNKIKIKLKINKTVKLKTDSVAQIKMDNVMGSKHISLTFGKSKNYIKNKDVLKSLPETDIDKLLKTVNQTAEEAKLMIKNFNKNQQKVLQTIYEILDKNKNKAHSIITNIDNIIQESKPKINYILNYIEESGPDLKKSLDNIENITSSLRNSKGTLGKIINDTEVYNELLGSVQSVRTSFSKIEHIVSKNENNIDQIIVGIRDNIEPAKQSFQNISEITHKIRKGEGTLGKLVNDEELYNTTNNTIKKVNENLEDQREQTIMSSFTNSVLGIFNF
jgi:phospholipid/cholesterol/gamma-HCH transport system substrate-binding protein